MEKLKLKPSSYLKGFIDEIIKKVNQLVSTSNELEDHKATANPTLSGEEATLTALEIGKTDYALPPVVTANPTLAGTESDLTGLQVGETKYAIPSGGTTVVANPTLAGTEGSLTGLQVGETKYAVPQGTNVVANPEGTATQIISTMLIGSTIYRPGNILYAHKVTLTVGGTNINGNVYCMILAINNSALNANGVKASVNLIYGAIAGVIATYRDQQSVDHYGRVIVHNGSLAVAMNIGGTDYIETNITNVSDSVERIL